MATSNHETRFLLTATDKTKVAIKSAEAGFKGLDSMVSKLAVGFAGLAGAGGIGVLVNSQIDAARQARAYSDALGLNIADLTRWQAAAETVGIGADKMADIFKDTSEKIGDAYRNNAGEAKEALESLGLSVEQVAQMAPDDQLLAIAGALQEVGTQGEKIQIMEALASDAALLLPLLDDNAQKLRELIELADASGRTLNDVEADKLLQAGEAMRKLNMEAQGLSQTLAIELSDAISTVIRKIGIGLPRAIETSQNMLKGLWLAFADDAEINALLRAETIQEKNIQRALAMQTIAAQEYSKALIELNGNLAPHQELRLARIKEELEAWNKVVAMLQNPPQLNVTPGGAGADTGGADGTPKISQDALSKMEETLTTSLMTRREIIMNAYLEEQEMIDMAETQGLETKIGYDEMRMQSHMKLNDAMLAEDEKTARKRAQIEAGVQNTISGLKQQGMGQAVGILRMLAQEHEGAAYAAIALEKALAIAQINIEANKAHMAAYGLLQLGLAGPMAVSAMHTKIEASRSFATGMTIAAGLFEAGQVGRSGGGGASATPVTPVESQTSLAPVNSIAAPAQGNQITIVIKGEGPFDDMVRNSIETLSDNDELVLIRG